MRIFPVFQLAIVLTASMLCFSAFGATNYCHYNESPEETQNILLANTWINTIKQTAERTHLEAPNAFSEFRNSTVRRTMPRDKRTIFHKFDPQTPKHTTRTHETHPSIYIFEDAYAMARTALDNADIAVNSNINVHRLEELRINAAMYNSQLANMPENVRYKLLVAVSADRIATEARTNEDLSNRAWLHFVCLSSFLEKLNVNRLDDLILRDENDNIVLDDKGNAIDLDRRVLNLKETANAFEWWATDPEAGIRLTESNTGYSNAQYWETQFRAYPTALKPITEFFHKAKDVYYHIWVDIITTQSTMRSSEISAAWLASPMDKFAGHFYEDDALVTDIHQRMVAAMDLVTELDRGTESPEVKRTKIKNEFNRFAYLAKQAFYLMDRFEKDYFAADGLQYQIKANPTSQFQRPIIDAKDQSLALYKVNLDNLHRAYDRINGF